MKPEEKLLYEHTIVFTDGQLNITVDEDFIKKLLTDISVELSYYKHKINIINPLSIDERIKLGNWFMTYLATEIGRIDSPMTRKELIERLQEFDEVDPEGKLPVTIGENIEPDEVDIMEYGEDKVINIK